MRRKKSGELVTVNAVSGTHSVMLAMNMRRQDTAGLLGFAIQRHNLDEEETIWLRSSKSFPSTRETSYYESVSSQFHPFQAFQWSDYSAKPGYDYKYKIVPMFGKPGKLNPGAPTAVRISAERAEGLKHSIYFNRAAIASQAYSKRFGPYPPENVGPHAFEWLTRDLLPGMLDFIARAKDSDFGLYAAIFELNFDPVLQAFRDAHVRGAKVRILYGAQPNTSTTEDNEQSITNANIRGLCKGREEAGLMHNKFIILTKKNKPVAIWTGSTNLSTNALYGQLNVGHAIDDRDLAASFFEYFNELYADPERSEIKDWLEETNDVVNEDDNFPLVEVFSPHRGHSVFDWYKEIAAGAKRGLFMTFPFGIVKDFRPVFNVADDVLRYALLEKYANGGNAASIKAAIKETINIRRLPNVGMALGSNISTNKVDGWLKESRGIGRWVNWVHTKFLLADPLGNKPITITGSANWSTNSVDTNDENMVVIRGDKRVADIYLTEFMRVFSHHRFRESVARYLKWHGEVDTWKPRDLKEDWREWLAPHYDKSNERFLRRKYFSREFS